MITVRRFGGVDGDGLAPLCGLAPLRLCVEIFPLDAA
jgi:hypothetical protein